MVGSVQVHNRRESVALDMKAYSHLSAQERIRIDELRNREGFGVCQIALRIGRGKSAVSREPGRGLWFASGENGSYRPYRPKRLKAGAWTSRPFYSAMTAQRKAEQRARQPRKPMRMAYDPLLEWVMDALRKGWTPELIEGRLKVEWPADPHMRISHECLHRWIHAKPRRALDLRRYLPKRTSFDDLTDEDLQAIVQEINDTPMKVLDWETPNEVWYRELGKVMSKTSHPKTSVALTN